MSAANLTQTGVVLGSVHYFSPEQARGVNVQTSSDLYSLGVVMYEMLTGRQPFRGDTPIAIALKQIQETPTPLRQYVPELHRGLEQLVMRLMAKEPDQRPRSADEVVSILQSIERELGAADPEEHTVVLEAIDGTDKEVKEVAAKKKRKTRKKQGRSVLPDYRLDHGIIHWYSLALLRLSPNYYSPMKFRSLRSKGWRKTQQNSSWLRWVCVSVWNRKCLTTKYPRVISFIKIRPADVW